MDTVYQIASIAFLLLSIVSIVLGILGKAKWQKIFISMAKGVDTAKEYIDKDEKVTLSSIANIGKELLPHTAKILLTAKSLGVDKDIDALLKKHKLNMNNKEE